MQSFWDWLIGEAGAGWIIGFLGILGGVYAWLKRERPSHVVVQEVKRTTLLDIHPSQKEKLEVYYTPEPENRETVQNLVQSQIVIYNTGTRDISEDIRLELEISEGDSSEATSPVLIEPIFDDPTKSGRVYDEQNGTPITGVVITTPYLNSFPQLKHFVRGYLVSNRILDLKLSSGSGKGWSGRFISLDRMFEVESRVRSILNRAVYFALASVLVLLALGSLIGLLEDRTFFQAALKPNRDNIAAGIQLCEETRKAHPCEEMWEALQTTPLLARFISDPSEAFVAAAGILLVLATALLFVRNYFMGWIISRYLGTQPTSRFVDGAE